jgi:hypothetical protein
VYAIKEGIANYRHDGLDEVLGYEKDPETVWGQSRLLRVCLPRNADLGVAFLVMVVLLGVLVFLSSG